MMKHIESKPRKFVAVAGLICGVVGLGLSAGTGTALADGTLPDTGTHDELVEVHGSFVTSIADSASQGAADDDGIQGSDNVTAPTLWAPNPNMAG